MNSSVTVITITRNDLSGLVRTIESVRTQSARGVEHIVIDGGSTDGTVEYLDSLGDSLVWNTGLDSGRYDAMNIGAELASGELLWFMHSSDVFHSGDVLERVSREYQRGDVSWRWGYGLSNIHDSGSSIGIGGRIPFSLSRFSLGGNIIPHQACVIEKSLHVEIGGYDTEFGLSADQLYLLKVAVRSEPRVWTEFFCDFDSAGAGSVRGMMDHYRDMRRSRALTGVTVFRSHRLDYAVSLGVALLAKTDRVQRRVLAGVTPRVR